MISIISFWQLGDSHNRFDFSLDLRNSLSLLLRDKTSRKFPLFSSERLVRSDLSSRWPRNEIFCSLRNATDSNSNFKYLLFFSTSSACWLWRRERTVQKKMSSFYQEMFCMCSKLPPSIPCHILTTDTFWTSLLENLFWWSCIPLDNKLSGLVDKVDFG